MKFGMRKVSPMKSFKARTTGRAKRAIKKAIITKSIKRLLLAFLIYLNRLD